MNTPLIVAAARLAKANSSEWSDFMKALHSYSENLTNNCISSPPDTLQVFQGRAQAARDILANLEDCVRRADAMPEKSKR